MRFDFARPVRFGSLLLWNHNQAKLTDRGLRKVRIYGSADGGATWRPLTASGAAVELPRASGEPGAEPHAVPNALASLRFQSVIVAAEQKDGNHGGNCYGLSTVRFAVQHADGEGGGKAGPQGGRPPSARGGAQGQRGRFRR